ncbi:MAG: hypothetical protein AMS27_03260 [Bacteroides sp. SM23_62_1]|nr:MAG: hypothetical protein AMS27_03260 [Bacteroides sp. SM23_62_1]
MDTSKVYYNTDQFVMGADLSYVNQILDFGGTYRDSGKITNPYLIFRKYGANVVRFRLFHTPTWTKEVYGSAGEQMYNDFYDVKLGMEKVKELGMEVCLDFHYSDTWADPGKQIIPKAWESLSLDVLRDSIYNYTFNVLHQFDEQGLMPEYVQVGNEINPGFVLPQGKRWNGNVTNFVFLLNAAISAVRNAGNGSDITPQVIIHIAQPENATNWFEGLDEAGLADYDIIGISYYYMWSEVQLDNVSNYISALKQDYGKEVMVMETGYPWTTENYDDYDNIIRNDMLLPDYPATVDGQFEYLKRLTQEIIDGGGKGIFYWEPAWISSNMKDLWGKGSSWECNTLFDFEGNVIKGMEFMIYSYQF